MIIHILLIWRCALTNQDLIRLFLPLVKANLTASGYDMDVMQAYQPTQTGAKTKDSVFFFEIAEERIGNPKRLSEYVQSLDKTVDTDTQIIAVTYQVNCLVRAPKDYTSQDVLSDLALGMQTEEFIEALLAKNVSILRIGAIRNNYFTDDRDQFQNSPSFDFTLIYNRGIVRNGKTLSKYEFNNIHGV